MWQCATHVMQLYPRTHTQLSVGTIAAKDTRRIPRDDIFHCCRYNLRHDPTNNNPYFLIFFNVSLILYTATNISCPITWCDATVAYFEIQNPYLHGTRGNPAHCVDIQYHKRQASRIPYFGCLLSSGGPGVA